jgi:flagellar motor switch protein FliM
LICITVVDGTWFASRIAERSAWAKAAMETSIIRDSIWEMHLAHELWFTDVELTAVMDERYVSLSDIFSLEVGSRIMFGATPDCNIEVRCAGVPMYTAKMGRRGSRIAVQIEDRIERNREG